MSKKPEDESTKKTSRSLSSFCRREAPKKEKNPNRVNAPYNVAKSELCKKLREEAIADLHKTSPATMGRPTTYCQEMADYIIDRVASTSCGLKTLCKEDPQMPAQDTVNLWRWKYPDFSERYLAAKQMQAHLLAESCEEEAKEKLFYTDASGAQRVDDGFTKAQKLLIDTRRWHIGKIAPQTYGDRRLVEEIKSDHDAMKAELLAIKADLDEKNKKEY